MLARGYLSAMRKIWRRARRPAPRTTTKVGRKYERIWGMTNERFIKNRDKGPKVYHVGKRILATDAWFFPHGCARALLHVLDHVDGESVLEVGSGRGMNLALLSRWRPDLHFLGLELTHNGLERAAALIDDPPRRLMEVSGSDRAALPESCGQSRVQLLQGDATRIPLADEAVDISFSCMALEQIPSLYDEAMAEMKRVTRKYVAFLEPFAEANNPLTLAHLRSTDYFRWSREVVRQHGLEPIFWSTLLPQKQRYRNGLLVTRVVR